LSQGVFAAAGGLEDYVPSKKQGYTTTTTYPQYTTIAPTTIAAATLAPTTTLGVTTTVAKTTTTLKTTTTSAPTTTVKATYACTRNAGYNPDSFIYLNSRNCGSQFQGYVSSASQTYGIPATIIDIGYLTDKNIALMECFYGKYYTGNPTFGQCPVLLCPKTGRVELMLGTQSPSSQINTFASKCRDGRT